MKEDISFNLKFVIGCFYGWINSHKDKDTFENVQAIKENLQKQLVQRWVQTFRNKLARATQGKGDAIKEYPSNKRGCKTLPFL